MAHGRCLMLLSVLSGQKTVTRAIEEAKISRALYYQLELRALKGMMRARSTAGRGEERVGGASPVTTADQDDERAAALSDAAQEERGAAVANGDEIDANPAQHGPRSPTGLAIEEDDAWRRLALIWERKLCGAEPHRWRAPARQASAGAAHATRTMCFKTEQGPCHTLIAADARAPFRTSLAVSEH